MILAAISNDISPKASYDKVNELILACSGSKEALCTLYSMFKDSVFAIAFGITGDYHLSEDCVAETFIRLTQTRKFDPNNGDGKGFIIAIARNTALELRRKFKREYRSMVVQSYGEADSVAENSIFVRQMLECLNDKQRQVVVLKCCSELTFEQIARMMKCPQSTIKSRYQKAMKILKGKAGAEL